MALDSLVAISGPKKVLIFRAPLLPMALVIDVAHIKAIKPKSHIRKGTLVILCTGVSVFCILYSVFPWLFQVT
jgi:hypothetical protein